MRKFILGSLVALLIGIGGITAFPASAGEFSGVTLHVLVTDPHTLVVEAWKPVWEKQTGGKIDPVVVPYASLYDKMMMDFITRTGAYDIIIYPGSWAGDVMGGNWVLPLNEYMINYGYPDWLDVMPLVKKMVKWGDKIMAFPYDGDCHMLYYRKDALENPAYQVRFEEKFGYKYNIPPKTWKEIIDVAKFFNGWDWDNDGEIEYGIDFIAKRKTQAAWSYLDIALQYSVLPGKVDKYHGVAFFDPETMEPLVNTPGWIEAMKVITELTKYAPPGILGHGYAEYRQAYVSGIAAIGIDWGDTGMMAQYPVKCGSKIKGLLGCSPLPGADKVWDRKEGKWIHKYNHVNFNDFGGWIWSIPKLTKHPVAAYKFSTFCTSPEHSFLDACGAHGETGVNPWRESHYKNLDKWIEAGWNEKDLKEYLDAIKGILTDKYGIADLRIPGAAKYYDYLDLYLNQVMSGTMSAEEACKKIYDSWTEITETYEPAKQLNLYRESLGLPPVK